MQKGTLYIVATPIGNLDDITLRAIKILSEVDLVLSEDTRETDKLFRKYQITKPQISYRDQNHNKVAVEIVSRLESGQKLALVSDSGTPLISDPGFKLIRLLAEKGLEIISIPGPSSVVSGLVVSGLPTDKFVFLGFLPKTKSQIVKIISDFGMLDATLVIFESPFRIKKLLEQIKTVLGNRTVCLVKDQTKVFEKVFRGSIDNVMVEVGDKPKGEFILYIAKKDFSY